VTELPGGDDEEITFVGPVSAAAHMAELGALPGMAARVAAVRAEMSAGDRAAAEEWDNAGGAAD